MFDSIKRLLLWRREASPFGTYMVEMRYPVRGNNTPPRERDRIGDLEREFFFEYTLVPFFKDLKYYLEKGGRHVIYREFEDEVCLGITQKGQEELIIKVSIVKGVGMTSACIETRDPMLGMFQTWKKIISIDGAPVEVTKITKEVLGNIITPWLANRDISVDIEKK